MTAVRDGDHFILNGKKKWSSSAGWDGLGTNTQCAIIRTDTSVGGTEGTVRDHHRTRHARHYLDVPGQGGPSHHVERIHRVQGCRGCRSTISCPAPSGNGDFVINRNFAWSGPVAAIAAVGVARSAYEDALKFLKTNTAGSLTPIIRFQNAGYIMGDVAAKIESPVISPGARRTISTSTRSMPN